MKYFLIGLLLVSVLLVSACSSDELVVDDVWEQSSDVVDEEVEEDILPELVDPDEYVEIGEMI